MERSHPRDIQTPAARAAVNAAVMDTRMNTTPDSLVQRGVRAVRSLVINRRCTTSQSLDTCEKPAAATSTILGILVGVGFFIFLIVLAVLYYLHLRRKRFDKAEIENDPHELSDYGLDDIPVAKGSKKESSSNSLHAPEVKQHRLSAQELLDAQNPFGNGAELADSDRVSSRQGSPPRYPGEVHKKM